MAEFLRNNEATVLFVAMLAALFVAATAEVVIQRRPGDAGDAPPVAQQHLLTLINQGMRQSIVDRRHPGDRLVGSEADIGLLRHSGLGFWPMLLLAILAFEMVSYWFHRAMHAFPILWRMQARCTIQTRRWISRRL
ncbi:MAG: hypothetical protein R3D30_07725 [Hyphomicrobiales bacterium]